MKIKFTLLLILCIIITTHKAIAQQDPQFTQFMNNKLFYNSAFAGSTQDKICVNLLGRTQWTGFGGGTAFDPGNGQPLVPRGDSPRDLVGGIHGSIGRFGIGAHVVSDVLGFDNTLNAMLDLAYKQPLDALGAKLAFGVGVGFIQKGVDGSKLIAKDPNDPLIPNIDVKGNEMDINAGIYYTMDQLSIVNNFYFGLSATHLNSPLVTWEWASFIKKIPTNMHLYAMTGAEYELNSSIVLNPNILYKTDMVKHQVDLNCMVIWNQNLSAGLTYRTSDAIAVLVGYQLPIGMQLGYSYDLTTSNLLTYSTGSHEITLRYCFGLKFPLPKPPIPVLTPRKM